MGVPAHGQDATLDAVLTPLKGMRGKPVDYGGPRNATPQLTVVKHALRDWVESRLARFRQDGDIGDLERSLNAELRKAGAVCGATPGTTPCPDWSELGFLGEVRVRRAQAFLVVETGVGIECGDDESAYLYSWSTEGWRRVWQNEQNTYTKEAYQPQKLHAVLVSPWNRGNDYLVLTLGSESWCQSALHNVYWRAYRLGPDQLAPPLVTGFEFARIDDDPPIRGSVGANDVLVQFTPALPDASQPAVRHYRIEAGKAKRVDPLALSPAAFVDEWLAADWRESALWSESADRGSLRDFHEKFKGTINPGDFVYPTMHCGTPDVWQVAESQDHDALSGNNFYFLVRWRPPYRFTMVRESATPSADCREQDRSADERRTLFP